MTFSSLCCQHVLTHTSEEPDRAKGEVRKCSWHWAGIAINQRSDSLHHYLLFLMIKILRVRDWERGTMALIRDCWQFSDAILNLCMYYEGGPGTSCFFLKNWENRSVRLRQWIERAPRRLSQIADIGDAQLVQRILLQPLEKQVWVRFLLGRCHQENGARLPADGGSYKFI